LTDLGIIKPNGLKGLSEASNDFMEVLQDILKNGDNESPAVSDKIDANTAHVTSNMSKKRPSQSVLTYMAPSNIWYIVTMLIISSVVYFAFFSSRSLDVAPCQLSEVNWNNEMRPRNINGLSTEMKKFLTLHFRLEGSTLTLRAHSPSLINNTLHLATHSDLSAQHVDIHRSIFHS
jgi:hypothetical protein